MIKNFFSPPFFYFTFLPFVFWPNFVDKYELPKVIFFIFLTFIIIGFNFRGIVAQNLIKLKIKRIQLLIFTLIIIFTLTSGLAGNFSRSFWGQYFRYEGLLTLITYFLFFLIISSLDWPVDAWGKAISLGGILISLLIICQAIGFYLLRLPIYNYNGRLAGFFGNPNFAAAYLALAFPFCCYRLQGSTLKSVNWFLFLAAILLTGSRSGLLAFILVTVFIASQKAKRKLWIAAGALVVAIPLMVAIIWRPASSFDARPIIWQKALEAWSKKPILGWGIENFEFAFRSTLNRYDFDLQMIRVDKAHNEFLEILVASGVIGLLVYLLVIKEAFQALWPKRADRWARANLLGFGAYLVLSSLNVLNVTSYLFFYFILANASRLKESN